MKNILALIILTLSISVFSQQDKPLSKAVLTSSFVDINGNEVTFAEILKKHQGKKTVLEVWASWCSDCVAAMPKLKELQKNNPKVDFVFISMDKTFEDFKKGVEKHQLTGDLYFSKTPWKKSEFAKNIKLDWIPRYMVFDEKGQVLLFKAIKPTEKQLIESLK